MNQEWKNILIKIVGWLGILITVIIFLGLLVFLTTPEYHILKQPNYWKCSYPNIVREDDSSCYNDIDEACTDLCHGLDYTWEAPCDYYECDCWHWYNIRIKGWNC